MLTNKEFYSHAHKLRIWRTPALLMSLFYRIIRDFMSVTFGDARKACLLCHLFLTANSAAVLQIAFFSFLLLLFMICLRFFSSSFIPYKFMSETCQFISVTCQFMSETSIHIKNTSIHIRNATIQIR